MSARCHIGTSGWVYPHWRGIFYPPDLPQSRWYDYYARYFATVEINYSFYRLPAEKTFDHFDMPDLPCTLWVTGQVVYLRFHGAGMLYAGQYGQVGLQPWAERIQKWLAEGRTVYAYFNNDAFGHAVEDAQMLREMVGAC